MLCRCTSDDGRIVTITPAPFSLGFFALVGRVNFGSNCGGATTEIGELITIQ